MATRVFFSFDFPCDLWRASVVRNRWVMNPGLVASGFWGKEFTEEPQPGRGELEAFVDEQLQGTDVTAVLIGPQTAHCAHVTYAIRRSVDLGRGLVGIYIDKCKDRFGVTSRRGSNPFDPIVVDVEGRLVQLAELVPMHDWVDDNGFNNLRDWVSDAMARAVVRL